VLVCIGVVDVDVDELETGVVDAAPRGVREDAEEVVVVLDAQRLFRLSQSDREVNAVRRTRRHNVGPSASPLDLPLDGTTATVGGGMAASPRLSRSDLSRGKRVRTGLCDLLRGLDSCRCLRLRGITAGGWCDVMVAEPHQEAAEDSVPLYAKSAFPYRTYGENT
jgi:hypothetical protein